MARRLLKDFRSFEQTQPRDTMETEQEPRYRYLPTGRAVVLVQQLDNGSYLVAPVVVRTEQEEDDYEYVDYDRPFVVKELFDSEPEHLYSSKLHDLQRKIRELTAEKDAMELAKRNISKEEEQIKARLASIPVLQNLFDYIDGKITHYAIMEYSSVIVVPVGDTKAEFARTQDAKKLLSLFGDTQGNLSWRLNEYSDGSGSWKTCIPARSYEEAVELSKPLFDALFSSSYVSADAVKSADKLGVEVPAECREKVRQMQIKGVRERIDHYQNMIEKESANLNALSK